MLTAIGTGVVIWSAMMFSFFSGRKEGSKVAPALQEANNELMEQLARREVTWDWPEEKKVAIWEGRRYVAPPESALRALTEDLTALEQTGVDWIELSIKVGVPPTDTSWSKHLERNEAWKNMPNIEFHGPPVRVAAQVVQMFKDTDNPFTEEKWDRNYRKTLRWVDDDSPLVIKIQSVCLVTHAPDKPNIHWVEIPVTTNSEGGEIFDENRKLAEQEIEDYMQRSQDVLASIKATLEERRAEKQEEEKKSAMALAKAAQKSVSTGQGRT